jgi:hypothetical protein
MPINADLSGQVSVLITAWLEVRILPGPPTNKIKHLADLLAAVATFIDDSCLTVVTVKLTMHALCVRLGVNRRRNAASHARFATGSMTAAGGRAIGWIAEMSELIGHEQGFTFSV